MKKRSVLERGSAVYKKHRERLGREHPGSYALVVLETRDVVVGDSHNDAWEKYYAKHALVFCPTGGLQSIGFVIPKKAVADIAVRTLGECAWFESMRRPGKLAHLVGM